VWLNATSLFLILFCIIVIVLGIVKIHEYPHKVALARNHPQAQAILVTSLLGLLVFPLWMFALVWAYGGVIGQPLPPTPAVPEPEPPADEEAEPTPSQA
jgi:hypothetical protein